MSIDAGTLELRSAMKPGTTDGRRGRRRRLVVAAALMLAPVLVLAGVALAFFGGLGGAFGAGPEAVMQEVGAEALAVHREAVVADLHIDPLLWNRDLTERSTSGDVDLPRLREGGVDIGVFGVVTAGLPIIGGWKLFTWWYSWQPVARRTRWGAALDQIDRLEALVRRSNGAVVLSRTAADVDGAVAKGGLAAMLGVEGAQALDGDARRVRTLHDRGVLYMGPVHLSGNDLGGSSFPVGRRGGLTPFGKAVVREMEAVGMFVDTAHLSEAAFWDVMRMTKGPVLCSHTGIYGVEPSWRNLKDDQLRAIAARGGVVGIMLATNFLGGRHISRWVEHVKHAVFVMGIEHVALGSDYDGFIPVPVDAKDISALPRLSAALLQSGFSAEDVKRIMGGNFLEMLRRFRPA